MLEKKEKIRLQKALKFVEKCDGKCNKCKYCHIYTGGNEKALYMAVGCDALPQDHFDALADTPSQLHDAVIETLRFELS